MMVSHLSLLTRLAVPVNKYLSLKVPRGPVMLCINYSYKTCCLLVSCVRAVEVLKYSGNVLALPYPCFLHSVAHLSLLVHLPLTQDWGSAISCFLHFFTNTNSELWPWGRGKQLYNTDLKPVVSCATANCDKMPWRSSWCSIVSR